jgi:hypothetical protein
MMLGRKVKNNVRSESCGGDERRIVAFLFGDIVHVVGAFFFCETVAASISRYAMPSKSFWRWKDSSEGLMSALFGTGSAGTAALSEFG